MQSVDTVTVLVLGKGGVGKSSTVNSLIGERVAVISAFQVHFASAVDIWRSQALLQGRICLLDFLAVVRYLYCCYSLRRKQQHLRMSRAGYNGKKVKNPCIRQELHTCLGRGETCERGMIVHRLAMVHRISMLCS